MSTLWLCRYRRDPLEWLWRWATWARRPPLRRTPAAEEGRTRLPSDPSRSDHQYLQIKIF
ncbi:hypothetical protein [Planomonospora sphaerica]|uniref:hypothetical protein n=1 Tax=Planomonospora sphaerica TaxID=161355 RepID=UPI001E651E40|nr:hypothetical protein [Planomonospora sphaerica]